ncbi:uncharacterized protein A4U43_C04F34270 [Asparagus officinalis]|uniref:LysM domain-containing protein n=2 Tax=Asparagus officinalis TaxID=4686 RepID=A0A5P1FAM4_ASPOF|nr:uncharacterized protein A4U43_C04F34270 [Asparagus officinalis]
MVNGSGNSYGHHHRDFSENVLDGFSNGCATIPVSSSYSPSSSCSGGNYIEHKVSKLDTVAGIAIKYGVEVADIRRMNGLVTDLQMFALDTLRIPLPGRHPPSPIVSNGSTANGEQTPPRQPHDDVLDSVRSLRLKAKPPRKVSPAMSSLQGYYGLTPPRKGPLAEGTEMALYKTNRTLNLDDRPHIKGSPATDPGFGRHRKSRSLVSLENADRSSEDNGEADKSIRRRPKETPEILMEESSGGFLGRIGKGLALRPKLFSRMDGDASRQNSTPIGDFLNDVFVSVRKSSSTSNLQESESSSSSSIWSASKWPSLNADAITRPIFDGLPKPMTSRWNKTALD